MEQAKEVHKCLRTAAGIYSYIKVRVFVERNGSEVELRILDYENPGSNPGCGVKTVGKFFILHCSSSLSCINEQLAIDSGGYVYEQPLRINCSICLDASQRSQDGV